MNWTIGCTTRPYGKLTFADACARIAAAGYTDVALFGNTGVTSDSDREAVLAAQRTVEDAGLAPSMVLAHARLDLDLSEAVADYRRLIDNAALVGARWLLDLGASQPGQRAA